MAVKIRLKRMGKIRAPYYRIVVADSRTKRDGRVIEEIGKYHPKEEPSLIEVKTERAQYWLGVGAQPTEAVEAILKVTGDWQTFRGESGTEGTLKVKQVGRTKQEIFNEILAESGSSATTEAVTKKAPAKKSEAKSEAKADTKAEAPAEAPAQNETPADEKPAVVADAATEDAPATTEATSSAQSSESTDSTESTEG